MIEIANIKLLKEEDTTGIVSFLTRYRHMLTQIAAVRRRELLKLRTERIYVEDLLRNKEWEVDLEEGKLMES